MNIIDAASLIGMGMVYEDVFSEQIQANLARKESDIPTPKTEERIQETASLVDQTASKALKVAPKILITKDNGHKKRGGISFASKVSAQTEVATEKTHTLIKLYHKKSENVPEEKDGEVYEAPERSTENGCKPTKLPNTEKADPERAKAKNLKRRARAIRAAEVGLMGIQTSVISDPHLYELSEFSSEPLSWFKITLSQSLGAGVNDSHKLTSENCAGNISALQSAGKVLTSVPRALFEIGKRIVYLSLDLFRVIKHTAIATFSLQSERRHLAKRAVMYNLGSMLMSTYALIAEPIRLVYRIGKYSIGAFSDSVRNGRREPQILKQMFFQLPPITPAFTDTERAVAMALLVQDVNDSSTPGDKSVLHDLLDYGPYDIPKDKKAQLDSLLAEKIGFIRSKA